MQVRRLTDAEIDGIFDPARNGGRHFCPITIKEQEAVALDIREPRHPDNCKTCCSAAFRDWPCIFGEAHVGKHVAIEGFEWE